MQRSLTYACGCTFTPNLESSYHSPDEEFRTFCAHSLLAREAGHPARRPFSGTSSTDGRGG